MEMNEKNKERIKRTQTKLDNKNLFPIRHRIQFDVAEFIDISDLKANELMDKEEFIKSKTTMSAETLDGVIDLIESLGFSPLKLEVCSNELDKKFLDETQNKFIFHIIQNALKKSI